MTKKVESSVEVDPIVEQLRALRETAGYEQQAVAEEVGVSKSHFSQIERGHADPRLSQIQTLCTLFDRQLVLSEKTQDVRLSPVPSDDDRIAVPLTPFQISLALGMLFSLARDYRHSGKSERLAADLEEIADTMALALGR